MTAPSNVWSAECDPEGWPEGVRGERLLQRPAGTRLASSVWELDSGSASPAYHTHHATEELLLVLSGRPTLRTPQGERLMQEGDVAHFPVGADGAHQVLNRSNGVVRYMMVAAHSTLDLIEYIDDRRVAAYSNADSSLQGEPLFFWHELGNDR